MYLILIHRHSGVCGYALACGACSDARLHGFAFVDPSIKVSRPQGQSPSVLHTLPWSVL